MDVVFERYDDDEKLDCSICVGGKPANHSRCSDMNSLLFSTRLCSIAAGDNMASLGWWTSSPTSASSLRRWGSKDIITVKVAVNSEMVYYQRRKKAPNWRIKIRKEIGGNASKQRLQKTFEIRTETRKPRARNPPTGEVVFFEYKEKAFCA